MDPPCNALGEGAGLAHAERDLVAVQGGRDEPGGSFKGDLALGGGRDPVDETGEAARAVAAHFGFAAVRVVVTHTEIALGIGFFDEKEAVGANAAVAGFNLRQG